MLAVNPRGAGDYKRWPSRSTGLSLDCRRSVAQHLAFRVSDGVMAVPRRGLEIGGLLLGHVQGKHYRVDSIAPIESEYSQGPVFRAPCADLEAVVRSVNDHGRPVGIYRSRTDGRLEIDEQDQLLLAQLEPFLPVAVLVIAQTRTTPAEARAGVWDGSAVEWIGSGVHFGDWLLSREETPTPALEQASVRCALPASP